MACAYLLINEIISVSRMGPFKSGEAGLLINIFVLLYLLAVYMQVNAVIEVICCIC